MLLWWLAVTNWKLKKNKFTNIGTKLATRNDLFQPCVYPRMIPMSSWLDFHGISMGNLPLEPSIGTRRSPTNARLAGHALDVLCGPGVEPGRRPCGRRGPGAERLGCDDGDHHGKLIHEKYVVWLAMVNYQLPIIDQSTIDVVWLANDGWFFGTCFFLLFSMVIYGRLVNDGWRWWWSLV